MMNRITWTDLEEAAAFLRPKIPAGFEVGKDVAQVDRFSRPEAELLIECQERVLRDKLPLRPRQARSGNFEQHPRSY